jgi:gamma-glutamyltranspeptidase/glutathione hydrolase
MIRLYSSGHRRGVVCAPHTCTVVDGQHILAEGGNALEAMIAMAASIAAVYPHMNHIGGDGFWLVHEPGGRVRAFMGAGPAGSKASPRFYRDRGLDAIPTRGPFAALTVPAAVSTWMCAFDAAKMHGGKLPLDVLLGPAIKHAHDGYRVTRSQHALTRDKQSEMADAVGFRDTFLLNGKVPEIGDVLTQSLFAQTLEQLARAGLDDFYRGDVGREIATDLERIGSPVTRDDLSRQRAHIDEPLEVRLNVGTLYNTPPPTQGLASLLILGLFDRLNVAQAESFAHIHGIIEATKRAFRVRDRVVADLARSDADVSGFVAARFLDQDVCRIDARRAALWPAQSGDGDTIWMGAADASGLVVSYIQSIYWEFGSGCVLPRTGILMQNRGASFSLGERALNALAPRRLPFHTLNPALAVLDDGRVMAYGTMGGDGQPQTQAAFFTRHVVFQQSLGEALDAPRWLLGRTWGSAQTNLRLEARFDSGIIELLRAAGHDVCVLAEPYSDTMGHAGAIVRHASGLMEGGHDPRADGGAAGM